jgi:hypothetical protein
VLYTNGKVADTHARNLVEIRIGEDLNQIPSSLDAETGNMGTSRHFSDFANQELTAPEL